MTPTHKPVVRESNERIDRRNVVVIVGPGNIIGFRMKGRRKVYETTIGACAHLAIKQAVFAERAAKKAKKDAKKKGY